MGSGVDGKTAKRYAKALFDAIGKDLLGQMETALNEAGKLWAQSSDLQEAIANPAISDNEKRAVVSDLAQLLFSESEPFKNFLVVLLENRRFSGLPEIALAFSALYTSYRNLLKLEVHSARELAESERQSTTEQLKSQFGSDVTVEWKVDRELIGGVLIKSGDKTFDNSVRGGLNRIKSHLLGS
ncbi:MAG: ATP synthase F1 subunit delta [Bdellovibrionales bacterium]|nr:ATP synthase F1 subunit delta [Bdellovibrionales bacterium]